MTEQQPGTPEGRRVVELLWAPTQQPPGRGPKPRLSLADVVAAGVAIADEEGLTALSMRKVASRLGVGAMSLYTYVPGRSELIELMIDRVYGEHQVPDTKL
ncbi:MAG TPA: helix-turn-helix domain-containing protein, partial [Propionibacteriaceae bacterium]